MFLKAIKRAINGSKRISNVISDLFYYIKNRQKIRLSIWSFFKLKRYRSYTQELITTTFNSKSFIITSPFWFLHSIHEIFVQEVYKFPSKNKNPFIIDCGANYGLSIIYFKQLYLDAKIIAFEADPYISKILKTNILRSNLSDINLIDAAVWKERTKLFFTSEGSVGGKIDRDKNVKNNIEISAIRLRDYLIQPVDFLKIDIEGAEYEVLKDCHDLLTNVQNLFIEYHVLRNEEQHLDDILFWISSAGFKYYIKEAWNNMSYPYMQFYNDYYQMQLNIFCYRSKF